MAYFLLKTEPSTFSWDDLVRDGKAVWDGVTNPFALKNIRSAKPGDLAILYHTGKERQAVGICEITSAAYPDPKDRTGKLFVFDLAPKKKLAEPVTLEAIKAAKEFAGSPLVKQGRLSVVVLDPNQWKTLLAMAKTKA
jgi:predicted RNA-binding protein with PUA-like domain